MPFSDIQFVLWSVSLFWHLNIALYERRDIEDTS